MDREALKTYCLMKKAATLEYPFEPELMVFKVMDKVFAVMAATDPLYIILKCDPAWAEVLRGTYPAVQPGWYEGKWNSVSVDGSIPDDEIMEMIDHSYEQVVKGMRKVDREKLGMG